MGAQIRPGRHTGVVARGPWNVNIHYDARLDRLVPGRARRVLDVGCVDGLLAARLAARVPDVVAIDVDPPVPQRAKARSPDASVTWVHGDVLTDLPGAAGFDAVVSNAALHHLADVGLGLRRLRTLVCPGGTISVVTFVHPERPDLLWDLVAFLARGVATRLLMGRVLIRWDAPVATAGG